MAKRSPDGASSGSFPAYSAFRLSLSLHARRRSAPPPRAAPRRSAMRRSVVFLGAPGVGKGTFAEIIAPRLDLLHLSTGDLVRKAIAEQSELGRRIAADARNGRLVPDDVIVPLVFEQMKAADAGGRGCLLDGFPRTLRQAQMLMERAERAVQLVVDVQLDEEVAIAKALGRRACADCGKGYNVTDIVAGGYDMPALLPAGLRPPRRAEDGLDYCEDRACERCGASPLRLRRREDDTYDVVKQRLDSHHQNAAPLQDFFRDRGLYRAFEVKRGIRDAPALEDVVRAGLAPSKL